MSRRVNIIYRVIAAIGVEIETVELLRVGVGDIVHVQESADFWIVIARLQVVKSRFYVVEISAVTDRVAVADMIGIGNICAVRIQHGMVSPCIVYIVYHNVACIVK